MKMSQLTLALVVSLGSLTVAASDLNHFPNCTNDSPGRSIEFKAIKNLDVVSVNYPSNSINDPRPSFIYNYVIQGVHANEKGEAVIYGNLIESKSMVMNHQTNQLRESFIVDPTAMIEIGFKETETKDNFALKVKVTKSGKNSVVMDLLDGSKGSLPQGPLGKETVQFELAKGLICDGMPDYLKFVAESHSGAQSSGSQSANQSGVVNTRGVRGNPLRNNNPAIAP